LCVAKTSEKASARSVASPPPGARSSRPVPHSPPTRRVRAILLAVTPLAVRASTCVCGAASGAPANSMALGAPHRRRRCSPPFSSTVVAQTNVRPITRLAHNRESINRSSCERLRAANQIHARRTPPLAAPQGEERAEASKTRRRRIDFRAFGAASGALAYSMRPRLGPPVPVRLTSEQLFKSMATDNRSVAGTAAGKIAYLCGSAPWRSRFTISRADTGDSFKPD